MKYFTSYYANYDNIPKNYSCVQISRTCPEGLEHNSNFTKVRNCILAPSEELLSDMKAGKITEDEYKKRYITEILTNIPNIYKDCKDLKDWIRKVEDIYSTFQTKYDAIVFMCYEAPDKFCHRHILAKLLTNIYHINCIELETKKEDKKKEDYSTDALF